MRRLALLLLALLSVSAAHGQFDDPDYMQDVHGLLGKGEMKRVLAVLARPDTILGEVGAATAHLSTLAPIEPVNDYASVPAPLPGLLALDFDTRPDVAQSLNISLLFETSADRDRFFLGLKRIYGEAAPECSDANTAHWLLGPGRSAAWLALDYGAIEGQVSIQASDPQDANCPRSTTPAARLLAEDEIEQFITRLRQDMPPLTEAAALSAWIEPYTDLDINAQNACDIRLNSPFDTTGVMGLDGFAGMNNVVAAIRPCGDDVNGPGFVAFSSFFGADMFAQEKFARVADAALGERYGPCSDGNQQVWALGDEGTLIVRDAYLSMTVSVYARPVTATGCELDDGTDQARRVD